MPFAILPGFLCSSSSAYPSEKRSFRYFSSRRNPPARSLCLAEEPSRCQTIPPGSQGLSAPPHTAPDGQVQVENPRPPRSGQHTPCAKGAPQRGTPQANSAFPPASVPAGKYLKRDLALCQSSVQNLCKLPYPLASFQQPRVTQSTMRRAYNSPYIGTNCRLDHVPGGIPILWPIVQPREDVAVKVGEGRHPDAPRDSNCWAPSSFFSLSPYP